MIIKSFEVNKVKFSNFKSILIYGFNKGFKEEVIKSNISSGFSGEILRYEESEVLDNKDTIDSAPRRVVPLLCLGALRIFARSALSGGVKD